MGKFINTVDAIGDDALSDAIINGSITEYKSDNIVTVGEFGLSKCKQLTLVDLPAIKSLEASAFYESAISTLILRGGTVCPIPSTSTINGTPIRNSANDGYVYVPSVLIDSYKAASNWSTVASKFRALEDYTVDGTVTGELDPTKI